LKSVTLVRTALGGISLRSASAALLRMVLRERDGIVVSEKVHVPRCAASSRWKRSAGEPRMATMEGEACIAESRPRGRVGVGAL
jgi:hypothetical protein